jgi:hypothetical protein
MRALQPSFFGAPLMLLSAASHAAIVFFDLRHKTVIYFL